MKPASDHLQKFHESLLEGLGTPQIPAELAGDGFLQSIYAHAADAQAVECAAAMESLVSLEAPADACWQEVDDSLELSADVASALPGPAPSTAAPGWLWARIREDVRTASQPARRRSVRARWVRYAAAAVLVISFALGTTFLSSDGTNDRPQFVFLKDFSLRSATEGLLGRPF
jgi:hypothetical protein